MTRHATFLWMQDLLEHLHACSEQWQTAEPGSEPFLADTMRRDLDELRRLCESLRGTSVGARGLALQTA